MLQAHDIFGAASPTEKRAGVFYHCNRIGCEALLISVSLTMRTSSSLSTALLPRSVMSKAAGSVRLWEKADEFSELITRTFKGMRENRAER